MSQLLVTVHSYYILYECRADVLEEPFRWNTRDKQEHNKQTQPKFCSSGGQLFESWSWRSWL